MAINGESGQAPDVKAAVDAAYAVLWDVAGNPTPAYARYLENQTAYVNAVEEFTTAENKALADPSLTASWPITAGTYQTLVDETFDQWQKEGAAQIEAALETVGSMRVPSQRR